MQNENEKESEELSPIELLMAMVILGGSEETINTINSFMPGHEEQIARIRKEYRERLRKEAEKHEEESKSEEPVLTPAQVAKVEALAQELMVKDLTIKKLQNTVDELRKKRFELEDRLGKIAEIIEEA